MHNKKSGKTSILTWNRQELHQGEQAELPDQTFASGTWHDSSMIQQFPAYNSSWFGTF